MDAILNKPCAHPLRILFYTLRNDTFLEIVLVIIGDGALRELGAKILEAAGTPREEAAWVSDCLVLSNLKGVDSHGVQQIPGYVKAIEDGFLKPGAKATLLEERAATSFYDGNWGYGYSIAREVMAATVKKAREAGAAFSGIRNVHHIGRVGKWAELALDDDMIGIASRAGSTSHPGGASRGSSP